MYRHLPNVITIARLAMLPFAAHMLLAGNRPVTLLLVAVIAISDWLDGFLARRWNATSPFGAVMDPLADKLTQFTLLALLAFGGRPEFGSIPVWLAGLVFARELFLVYGALRIRQRRGNVTIRAQWEGKASTAFVFVLLLLALFDIGQRWVDLLSYAATLLIILSTLRYYRDGAAQVRDADAER